MAITVYVGYSKAWAHKQIYQIFVLTLRKGKKTGVVWVANNNNNNNNTGMNEVASVNKY